MPTGKPSLASDGEWAIEIGPWAKEKLLYIRSISDVFNIGMKNKWSTRKYIDLSTGPGICVVGKTEEEIHGSPLIALGCKTPFTHYFFNDINPAFISALQSRAASRGFTNAEYFYKDCNSVVSDLLTRLPTGSLDFCFIDPLNWEIDFNSIRKLTDKRKMDLAITFHIGNIKRTAAIYPNKLVDFFPDSDWKQEYENAKAGNKPTGRVLLDAYERGLSNIGYKYIRDGVLEKNQTNVPLYYLIFASKHSRGSDFWDKVTARLATGQIRMQI